MKRQFGIFESLEARALLAADVVISELMAVNDNMPNDFEGKTRDWIEIHNRGDEAVNLAGWKLAYGGFGGAEVEWAFPDEDLAADGYLVVLASGKDLVIVWPKYEIHTNFKLAGGGGRLALLAPNGEMTTEVVSEITYPNQHRDVSYGLVDDKLEYFNEPTPGTENLPDLVISEFMARNETTLEDVFGEASGWIEIHNRRNEAVHLAGWELSHGTPHSIWSFHDVSIEPQSFLVVMASGRNVVVTEPRFEIHTNSSLARFGHLSLISPEGNTTSKFDYPPQVVDESFGTSGDRSQTLYFVDPTPGTENPTNFEIADLVITEFMTRNETTLEDAFGETPGWIEIHNRGDKAAHLAGWKLLHGDARRLWTFPQISLEPHGFLVVFASGQDVVVTEPKLEIHTSFELDSKNGYLSLISLSGSTATEFDYRWQRTDVSFGFASEGSQIPFFLDPTPGAENPAEIEFPDLVISEIMVRNETTLEDTFGETSDWIEIHNRGDETAYLAGWQLHGGALKPGLWSFPEVSIEAHGYLVVFTSGRDVVVTDPKFEIHTNFGLGTHGFRRFEFISPWGSETRFSYPWQPVDVSFGISGSRGQKHFFVEPTPGAENSEIVYAGDANFDGVFDSSDLVLVFQEGDYEDERRNSKWTEGDWNHDEHFDSSDLILAFQTGRYVHAAVQIIIPPEEIDERFCLCFSKDDADQKANLLDRDSNAVADLLKSLTHDPVLRSPIW